MVRDVSGIKSVYSQKTSPAQYSSPAQHQISCCISKLYYTNTIMLGQGLSSVTLAADLKRCELSEGMSFV